MTANFIRGPLRDHIQIIPDSEEEAQDLHRWHNCVLTTQYSEPANVRHDRGYLLIVKET